ncbi:MAG: hypothetical protein AAF790_00765 [Planctomycetota bacterium]
MSDDAKERREEPAAEPPSPAPPAVPPARPATTPPAATPAAPAGANAAEPNPFASPQSAEAAVAGPGVGVGRRLLLVAIGVVLGPIATGLCAFCCCTAGIPLVDVLPGEVGVSLLFVLFGGGAIGGIVLTVFVLRRVWRSMVARAQREAGQ